MTTIRRRAQRPKLATTSITARVDITHDLWKVWIEKPDGYQFKPGQYCTIGVDGIERAYSIVSAPYEDELELFVELVPPPDGNLTPLLHEMKEGQEVTIRPRAKGIFVLDPKPSEPAFRGNRDRRGALRQHNSAVPARRSIRPPLLRTHGRELRGRVRLRLGAAAALRGASGPRYVRADGQPPPTRNPMPGGRGKQAESTPLSKPTPNARD